MNATDFTREQGLRPCRHCGRLGVEAIINPNNNGLQVVCPACGSRSPWGATVFLKQSNRQGRPPLPGGKSLDDVWADYGHHCVSCSLTSEDLRKRGIGRHAHHVLPYREHGHAGSVVPLCAVCHQIVTALQRAMSRLDLLHPAGKETDAPLEEPKAI